ncbi:MAG: LCP family protein, partial [Actinomycetota bacterium]|nr:LCP family protein [Actinomycetota bacterium]
ALSLAGRDLPSEALADLMGVTVDGSWVLDLPTLSTLVDRLGGIPVDVDRDVLTPQPDGSSRIVVPAGSRQRLGGTAAAAYATYLAAGEQEIDRLPRLQRVLQGIVGGLPGSAAAVQATVTALGPGSVATAPGGLAPLLVGLGSDLRADALPFSTLPVLPIDTGSGTFSYRIDPPAVRAVVDRELADSVPAGSRAGGNRVLVLNGVGTPGTGDQVRGRLVANGLVYAGSRNAPNFDYATSQVLIFDAGPVSRALGQRVASVLGLPPTSVGISTQAQSVADVIVVVGADFKP